MSSSDIDDPLPPDRDPRKVGAVFAAVVLLVVAAAIVIPTVEAGAKAPSGLTAASAASTVRQFVDQAVVQGDGYTACALLTSSEQAAIARLGGTGDECRAVLGGDTSLLGVSTASDITGLDLHTDGARDDGRRHRDRAGRRAGHLHARARDGRRPDDVQGARRPVAASPGARNAS